MVEYSAEIIRYLEWRYGNENHDDELLPSLQGRDTGGSGTDPE